MGRWRSKLLLTLIVYGAGFATAMYVRNAPQADQATSETAGFSISQWLPKADNTQTNLPNAGLEPKPWADTAHAVIGKAASFAKEQSVILAEVIKTKVEQNTRDRGD
ncbi:MAG: hypothetical protein ACYSUT_04340 [Planctomycetota bacterium]